MSTNADHETQICPAPSPRVHLKYLDGLRGIAAIYVSIFHVWQTFYAHIFLLETTPSVLSWAASWAAFGRTSVSIFIVLSGYVLMMPVVRSTEQSLRGGVAQFLRRRAWRILPPYYAALLTAAVLSVAFHRHEKFSNLLAHIFLIHNIRQAWEYGFDVPMWSVAVEWQIYFVFALLLLPIWKRFGALPTLATAFTIGLGIHFLTHGHFDRSSPWYLGLFALGMLAAEINYSRQRGFVSLRTRLPWLQLSALFALSFLSIEYAFMIGRWHYDGKDFQQLSETWALDLLVGLAAACLAVGCTYHITDRASIRPPIALRFLGSRPLVFLGAFSYSYYLIHVLVLGAVRAACRHWHPSILLEETLQLILGIPMALLISYGFFLVAERPFHSSPARKLSSLPAHKDVE